MRRFIHWALFALIFSPILAFAQATTPASITINPNIPGTNTGTGLAGPGALVANIYQFALLIGGILAFGAIVWGGVKYTFGAGNSSAQEEGKEWVKSAIYGLLLLIGAYLILYTINPNILKLELPGLPQVGPAVQLSGSPLGNGGGGGTNGNCPIPLLPPITDPQAQAMENGQRVIFTSSNPNVQSNLTKLSAEVSKLTNVLQAAGDTVTVESAYRPLAYQTHFYNIYQRATQYNIYNVYDVDPSKTPSYANITDCAPVIAAIRSEESKHQVCSKQSQCLVASPNGCSAPHTKGIGVDINISGPVHYRDVNALLQSNGIDLSWQALSATDPVHFNLLNPPFTGCASS